MEKYYTIAHEGKGRLTEKMSRFLAFAYEINSREEAKIKIKEVTNAYHDARHVCWAYMVGAERTDYLSTDNGEPSGTAGKPILGQINSVGLTNVIVIVVRYFGGIKLGTPGLIAAYRESARLALEDAGKKEVVRKENLHFEFPYQSMNGVMKLVKENDFEIVNQTMDNLCRMTLAVPISLYEMARGYLNNIDGLTID